MAARSDQGVFNMNGNPELNVDVQYLAYTSPTGKTAFSVACVCDRLSRRPHRNNKDGQPSAGSAAGRPSKHSVGTYGETFNRHSRRPGTIRFVGWGALQNGQWESRTTARAPPMLREDISFRMWRTHRGCAAAGFAAAETTIPRIINTALFLSFCPPRASMHGSLLQPHEPHGRIRADHRSPEAASGNCAATCTGCSLLQAKTSGTRAAEHSITRSSDFRGIPAGDLTLSPALSISVQTGTPRIIWTSAGIILTCGARGCPAASIRRAATLSSLFWSWFSTGTHRSNTKGSKPLVFFALSLTKGVSRGNDAGAVH